MWGSRREARTPLLVVTTGRRAQLNCLMEDDLIITAGNRRFFDDLRRFVVTLRGAGEYRGRIALCDNVITGTWDAPGTYLDEPGFDDDQLAFFAEAGVDVVRFSDLVRRNGVSRESIEAIEGRTQRYPYKFIYACLLSKEHLGSAETVYYFDSDVIFQRSLSELAAEIAPGHVYMASEHGTIGDLPFMSEWIKTTDVSTGGDNDAFVREMHGAANYCTGFLAGDAATFNRFMQLCWALASSGSIAFHTDQPLVNILHSYFGYPVVELGKDLVLHLKGAPEGSVSTDRRAILYEGTPPVAVHFNGASRDVVADEDGEMRLVLPPKPRASLLRRAVRRIRRR